MGRPSYAAMMALADAVEAGTADQAEVVRMLRQAAPKPQEMAKRELADLVADGMTAAQAGRQMGISQQMASRLWGKILEDMG